MKLYSFALALAVLATPVMAAPDFQHDAHKLSADETRAILPAVCQAPKKTKGGFNCAALTAYPSSGDAFNVNTNKAAGEIALDAVAYGSFTAKGADEAYVTYSGLESHANNMGGGILLARAKSGWKALRWVPGEQMDKCVALPDTGPQRMLCLSAYEGQGEADSSVWILDLSPLAHGGKIKRTNVLKAQDGRAASNADYYCKNSLASHRDMLLSVDDLTRSHENGILATSKITTADAADVATACGSNDLSDLGESSGVLRYRFVNGTIRVEPTPKFAAVDY